MKRLQSEQMLLQNLKSLKMAAVVAVACCTVLGSLLVAQIRNRPRDDQDRTEQPAPRRRGGKTPRAIGVLEITGGDARLIPVSIMIDGKFYDASVYKADPQPMAVEPETVYEGQKNGEPAGLFTVAKTQQLNGNWVGLGMWDVKRPGEAPKEVSVGTQQSDRPRGMDDDAGPPKLRRPGSSGAADKTPAGTASSSTPASAPSSQTAPATANSAPSTDKPTPSDNPASEPKPGSAESKPTGKPSLSRPGETPSETKPAEDAKPVQADNKTAAKSSTSSDDDAARPVLRRGNTGGEQAASIPTPASAGANAPVASGKTGSRPSPRAGYTDTLVAVSDAGGPTPRAFTMMLRPDERAGYEQKMTQYASDAIRKFAVTHPIRDRQAPHVALTDLQMHVFDVNSSNEPVLVFTARAPETAAPPARTGPSPQRAGVARGLRPEDASKGRPDTSATSADFQYYVTVVARVDVNGEVRKLMDSVTDTSHLDAIPRLQLIDCVDANGDGVGELLFRENYDRSRAYSIYRVGMDQLWQLFEGAQTSFSAGQ